MPPNAFRIALLTSATLVFFAANSLLARLALRGGEIDAASFTAVRIASGAAMLALVLAGRREGIAAIGWHGSATAAAALFAYAVAFSFAYRSLEAGTGALILFAAVQVTMIASGLARGERPGRLEWIGLAIALAGLAHLVSPGMAAPPLGGALLMAASGAAWGFYSLAATGARSPVGATAGNFARATPMGLAVFAIAWAIGRVRPDAAGFALAVVSGAITSGLGYVMWYAALQHLSATRAAIVQLTVPVIAAAAGVLLLGEQMSWRLAVSAAAILGGVGLALAGRGRGRMARHEKP